jgi:hypothetical protein
MSRLRAREYGSDVHVSDARGSVSVEHLCFPFPGNPVSLQLLEAILWTVCVNFEPWRDRPLYETHGVVGERESSLGSFRVDIVRHPEVDGLGN